MCDVVGVRFRDLFPLQQHVLGVAMHPLRASFTSPQQQMLGVAMRPLRASFTSPQHQMLGEAMRPFCLGVAMSPFCLQHQMLGVAMRPCHPPDYSSLLLILLCLPSTTGEL